MTAAAGIVYRRATDEDLPDCAAIWREALNAYLAPLGVPPIPEEPGPIGRLHAHLRSTDPDRFLVAVRPGGPTAGFVSAVVRGDVWFLSMLFVRPADQGRGIGPELLARVLPGDSAGCVLAVATDSAQPISNALYARHGMVPRIPLLNLVGRPRHDHALPALPTGLTATVAGPDDATAIDAVDREVLGYAHPEDHGFVRAEGRQAFVYRTAGGRVVGYGCTSALGRVGPIAVTDAALLAPVAGHLLHAIEPRGASAVWVPGSAGATVTALLEAGLRLEGFPVLLGWSAPFADFARYVPISPGLL